MPASFIAPPALSPSPCNQICKPSCVRAIPAPVSLVSVCSGIMVAIHLALSTQSSMGFATESDNFKGMQLSILVFACLTFMLAATSLALVKPDSPIVNILLQRIMKPQDNWANETLRSFTELYMWMCVNWCTYGITGSVAISVACGTLTGIFSVLVGEYLSIPLHAVEKYLRRVLADRPSEEGSAVFTSGSMMVVVVYGYSIFHLIYENCLDILLATLVVATAGAVLLTVAKGLAMFQPTARAGELLTRRILDTGENWKKHTMRSLLEASAWMAITLSNFAAYGDAIFAFKIGTLCGILICLAGEYLTPKLDESSIPNMELTYWWRTTNVDTVDTVAAAAAAVAAVQASKDQKKQPLIKVVASEVALDYSVMLTFTYTMGATLLLISGNKGFHWLMALVLSTLTGIAYIIAGKLFLSLPATHFIGTVILDRFKSTRLNWEQHTGRSTIETSLWLLATAMAWKWSNGSYFFTIPFGTSMGIIVVLLSTVFGWGKPVIWKQPTAPTNSAAAASTTASTTSASTTTAGAATNNKQTKVRRRRTTTYEWSEVQWHSSRHDCWIVIHGIVYDITKWGPKHPGGSIIYKYGGKDCSDQFEAFHRPHVKTRLSAYKIGVMSKDANAHTVDQTSDVTLAYRNLRDTLWKEGHFNANPTYFYWKHVVWVSFIAASIALVVVHHHGSSSAFRFVTTSLSTWQVSIIAGCTLGLGWQQVAFVAHDAAHNGIIPATKGGGLNWLGWFLGSPMFGISSALWTEEHNAHHAVTLRPREDPQFNYLPLWMISEKELSVKVPQGWSGEAGQFPMNGVVRFLISIQHWTFLPLCMLIGRFNFYLISLIYSLKLLLSPSSTTLDRCRSVLDLLGMSMYWLWFVSVTSMFQATSHRAIFVLASHWTVGILHVQLLLSHLATTTFTAEEEEEAGFFQFQLGTSRNIDVYAYEHWFHGGLEYQIEHHLFPQLPRHQLAVVQPMVIEICQKHNIQYRSVGFMAALQECLSDFKRLATDIITLEMG